MSPHRYTEEGERIRQNCSGSPPLSARLEQWMLDAAADDHLFSLIAKHGSPLNVISTSPFVRNIRELREAADLHKVDFEVYFARKANKCLSFVEAATAMESGIDVASLQELEQTLAAGHPASKVICTAAVKSDALLERCATNGVTVAVDNCEELQAVHALRTPVTVALRLSHFMHKGKILESRFGIPVCETVGLVRETLPADTLVAVRGIHFHLDGYDPSQRVSAIRESLEIVDNLVEGGHEIEFIDIGGGLPVCYLQDESEWMTFWDTHRKALVGDGPPVTYRNHTLGRFVHEGAVLGTPNSYPFFQARNKIDWLHEVLRETAGEISSRSLQLRCEPGRALLDGCGITAASVEFTKSSNGNHAFFGLSMNRTQCRTSSDDFLVDPLHLPLPKRKLSRERRGYLVGAYCTESELLSLRKLTFPSGIEKGDLILFPNAAGYFMHFLESRSHQFPLAKNYNIETAKLDKIDDPGG